MPESTSEAVTQGIRVRVRSRYVPERSKPEKGQWFFAYTVEIENGGRKSAMLESRHWIITDAHGHVEEVRGPGVVGKQPVLAPGEVFEYTSGCPLRTPFGSMRGTYRMITKDGEVFEAEIAAFALVEPYAVN